MAEIFAIQDRAFGLTGGGDHKGIVPRNPVTGADVESFMEKFHRGMDRKQWPENRVHIRLSVGNGNRGGEFSCCNIQELLNDLVADYASPVRHSIPDKVASDRPFGSRCTRVHVVDKDVGVEKRSTAHSSPGE